MTVTEQTWEPGQIVVRPPTLLQKLRDVIAAIGVVEKDKKNAFHNYDYASIEAVVEASHDALTDAGIVILAGQETTEDRQRSTNQGEATVTTVELVFRIYDTETGESIELPWVGRGEDPADKGVAKALTDARKSFLIQQLNLRRGEDTEADPQTDARSNYGGAQTRQGYVDLNAEAKGLSNAQLNAVLVSAGLQASEKPWGSFFRVPTGYEGAVRDAIAAERAR